MKAKLLKTSDPKHSETLANIMLKGGIVGALWGHHLYFLACNACDVKAVERMNKVKGRPKSQVFASPGAAHEAQEFADFKKSKGLVNSARKMRMSEKAYIELLFKKFPLAVELFAKENAPSSVAFATKDGKTIWIAGHSTDKNYTKLLEHVRNLRKSGKNIVFAGTSLNLRGDNTLTVRQLDKVIEDFGEKIDAIAIHPGEKSLKKLKYSTSSSAVSFTGAKPKLLRLGCTKITTLKKYIPDLQIPSKLLSTRR